MEDIQIVNNYEICAYTEEQARNLTEAIKSTTKALWTLLKKAHDEKAYIALGYTNWSEYIANEFNFSRGRSYQLLNQAEVIEQIEEASGARVYITERDARNIKKNLGAITEKIKLEIESKGNEITESEKFEIIDKVIQESDTPKPTEENTGYEYDYDEVDYEAELDKARKEGYKEGLSEVSDKKYDQKKMDADAYSKEFFVENLMKLLSMIEYMPGPEQMFTLIKKSKADETIISSSVIKAQSYLEKLSNNLNKGCGR